MPLATCFPRECRFSGGLDGSASAAVLLPAAGCCSGPAVLVDVAGCRSGAGAAALFDGCFSGAACFSGGACFSGAGGALAAGGSSRCCAAGATATLSVRDLRRECFSAGGDPESAASASRRDGGLGTAGAAVAGSLGRERVSAGDGDGAPDFRLSSTGVRSGAWTAASPIAPLASSVRVCTSSGLPLSREAFGRSERLTSPGLPERLD